MVGSLHAPFPSERAQLCSPSTVPQLIFRVGKGHVVATDEGPTALVGRCAVLLIVATFWVLARSATYDAHPQKA